MEWIAVIHDPHPLITTMRDVGLACSSLVSCSQLVIYGLCAPILQRQIIYQYPYLSEALAI